MLVYNKEHCEADYYQTNALHDYHPTFYFDLIVNEEDEYGVSIESRYHNIYDMYVLAPDGRVIKSFKNHRGTKNSIVNFRANTPGKYVLKYRLLYIHIEPEYSTQDCFYRFMIRSTAKESMTIDESTSLRVYSLLGVAKDGSLFDGEMKKEKCLDNYQSKDHARVSTGSGR